ncbi:MAG: hypothetical protein H7322_05770 [Ramlibacter sp.]|nr:hypothetical protein [Ramlibacter sp.]
MLTINNDKHARLGAVIAPQKFPPGTITGTGTGICIHSQRPARGPTTRSRPC